MAENSNIEWCDHTFNPWIGCSKVSLACDNCYAEGMMDRRYGRVTWGPARTHPRTRKGSVMGYHPETLVYSFPHYDGWLSRLSSVIGFDVWHIDPEKRGTGNRTDDSCGWFDRTPGIFAEAVDYLLNDASLMHEVNLILARKVETLAPFYPGISERQISYPRLPASDCLAACLLVARELEHRRWWNGARGACQNKWRQWFTRRRKVDDIATDLALNPLDNFSSIETPESLIRLMAAALNRHSRPWWRHPRWHVHHWKINFNLARNIKRALFVRCHGCKKALGWNCSATSDGGGRLFHSGCYGLKAGSVQ